MDFRRKHRSASNAIASNVVEHFSLGEHISQRTSLTVVRVQVVGVCEVRMLAGMPGLVIVLDKAYAY